MPVLYIPLKWIIHTWHDSLSEVRLMLWALTFVVPKLCVPFIYLHWAGFLSLFNPSHAALEDMTVRSFWLILLLYSFFLACQCPGRVRASTVGKGCKPYVQHGSPSTWWMQNMCMHSLNHEEGIYGIHEVSAFSHIWTKHRSGRLKETAHSPAVTPKLCQGMKL